MQTLCHVCLSSFYSFSLLSRLTYIPLRWISSSQSFFPSPAPHTDKVANHRAVFMCVGGCVSVGVHGGVGVESLSPLRSVEGGVENRMQS